jgi:dTDP-4-dehydrorhamnose 3,5-epimerase
MYFGITICYTDDGTGDVAMPPLGVRDAQTVIAGGRRAVPPRIVGVQIFDLGNIITRSGWMAEVFRTDWPVVGISVRQVNWVQLSSGAVTDWHCHTQQTDHLIGVGGNIKLALWDDRADSPSKGSSEIIRIGAIRPVMVIVPPGIWHGLRNESGAPAGYINVTDQLYDHAKPDNWRLVPGVTKIPDIL